MRIASIIVSSAFLLSVLPRAMGQRVDQFLAVYNMTSPHFDRQPGLARRVVRLAFHDAMGGVDAHIDLSNEEHRGLNGTFRFINRLWQFNMNMTMENMTFMGGMGGGRDGGMRGNRTGMGEGGRGQGGGGGDRQGGGGGGRQGSGGGGRQDRGGGGGGRGQGRKGNNTDGGGMMRDDFTGMPVSLEGLAKADFFAWVYISAFYHSCRRHIPWVPLRVGRTTFDEAQLEDTPPKSEFGSGDHAAVLEYFEEHFGFNEGQVAVLLGAHTLGGASRRHSGFEGDWTGSPGVFNNEYYENLVFPGGRGGWEQISVANGTQFEWRWGCNNRCRDLMLNVDMNLFYNLDDYFVGDAGQVQMPDPLPDTAPPGLCDDPEHVFAACFPERTGSASHMLVSLFEDGNNEMFLDNFAMVFGDMVSRVKDDANLEYVAPPADWPGVIRMGRGGRGRPGHGGGPGRGPPGRGPPRGCNTEGIPDGIMMVDDLDDFEDEVGNFEDEVDAEDEEEEAATGVAEFSAVGTATSRAGDGEDPFDRRLLRTSA